MRTGTKKCVLLLLAIIVLCFAVWLLWPHSFAEVTGIPAEYPASSKSKTQVQLVF